MIKILNSKFVKVAAILVAVFAVVAVAVPATHAATSCTFTRGLTVGSTGADVMCLQQYLNGAGFTVSTTGAGAPGAESTYFGAKTRAAVSKWQAANGVTPTAGYFGSISRAKYDALMAMGGTVTPTTGGTLPAGCTSNTGFSPLTGASCGTGAVTPVTGGGLTVTAGTQPANSLAPQSASRVPFTTFTLTAGASSVHVNGVVVQRSGLAQDAVFSGLVLVGQDGIQVGTAKTLGSTHQAVLDANFDIPAGQSRTYTVAGNMASSLSSYAGQVASIMVVGVNTSATVGGTLPITGASHTVNASLTIGSAQAQSSTFDPATSQTKEIGTTGYRFSGIRLNAGSGEDVRLWSVRWYQSGSAGASDLANIVTVVNGTEYPTVLSSDGKYYTSTFGNGIVVAKGNSIDVYVKGDIVGASGVNRTIFFDIYKTTDVYLTGETYGYGLSVSGTSPCATSTTDNTEFVYSSASCAGTASTPWFSGSKVTINGGSATSISKANSVAAQNIALNVPSQPLGGIDVDIKGEPITVASTVYYFNYSSGAASSYLLTNVSLYDSNGAVVAGPVDATNVGGTAMKVTFTDTITYPIGKRTYTLKGKLPTGVSNGVTLTASTTPSTDWTNVTGQVTGNAVSLSSLSSAVSLNPMTVRTAALAIAVSTDPAAQTMVAGSQQRTFARYQLDASQSGEDVRFSTIILTLAGSGTATNLTTCQLYDGATALNTGSNVVNPSAATATFTFDNSLTVTKGTVKTLDLKCNIVSGATGTFQWGVTTSTTNPSITGVTSGSDVDATGGTLTGQIMTMGSATLVASTDSSSPGYAVAAGGASGVTAGVIKFRASNQAVNLDRIGLKLTNTASSSASDVVLVTLWDGATQVGSAVFTGTSIYATSTLSVPVLLPKDADKTITVKANLADVGSSLPGGEGVLIAIDVDTCSGCGNTKGTGVDSGTEIDATGTTAFSGIRMFNSYPTLALDTLPSNGVADGRLMRFKVTADSANSISLYQFKLTLATTSASVTGVNLFGFTDSAYSQPISGVGTGGQVNNTSATQVPNGSGVVTLVAEQTDGTDTTIVVPAGGTRWFEARGTVTGSGTTYSVTTTLNGDSSANNGACAGTPSVCMKVAASAGSALVWSPNATTTTGLTGNDWTNGFGLPGFPSNGIIQTRNN